jgi:ABC-type glycerol-3-phosphate transport system substrate-binding protein
MNKSVLFATATAAALFAGAAVAAPCEVEGDGEVNVLTNFFATLELLAQRMEECEREGLTVDVKLSTEHQTEQQQAFAAGSSPYDAAAVANASITLLQARGQLLPLNEFVEKYRDQYGIEDQMLIRFGDDIMAVAFMVNAAQLYYRKDVFDRIGLEVPTTYPELLETAEALEGAEGIDYPFIAAYGNSWELANEFMNMFIANGGQPFDPVTSEPTFSGPEAVQTLEMMGSLMPYASPNAMSMDFGAVRQALQQGQVGMAILWGDQAPSMDNPAESKVVGQIGYAPAPAMVEGGPPSSLFWWDGYVIPRNLDGDPEVTFQVIMHAISADTVAENNDITLWVRSNYQPNQYTQTITDTVMAGAPPYPMEPQAALAHAAIGDNISDFLVGRETAQQSLDDAAAAYRAAAIAEGLLQE